MYFKINIFSALISNYVFQDNLGGDQSKISQTGSQLVCSVNVAEFRSLVKTLVGGVKTITWGFFNSKVCLLLKKRILLN